ncbi:MAG TPA: hydroxymethylbilane synthase [Opitutaceae bacterium]|jgi:hydroxymethylbilane synthase
MAKKIVLATRRSPLALAQAELAAAHLRAALGAECELLPVVTTGDRQADWSLGEKGGKGLFTRELEEALLRKEATLAVHSAKDLPGEAAIGLSTAGYLPREDARDVLAVRSGVDAPRTLATGSPRRRRQASLIYADPKFCEIRGNVDTRLRKIAERNVADATILAAAGLKRLGIGSWPGLEFRPIAFDRMVPAVGQGAIALQCRSSDLGEYDGVFDAATGRALSIERAVQSALGAGCQTALGVHAAGGTLYFYHEDAGVRRLELAESDFADPAGTAARLLASAGLR